MGNRMEKLLEVIDPVSREQFAQLHDAGRRQMSMRIDAFSYLCLEKLAAHTGLTKTGLAQDLLEAACQDAAKHYDLTPTEDEFCALYQAEPQEEKAA
jgi:hypothetical protein